MNAPVPHGPALLLRRLGRALLGVLYPPLCLGCEGRLPADGTADGPAVPLCPACLRALPRADPGALLPRLARFPGGAAAFEHAAALWLFDDGGTLQRLQHALKYGNRPTLGVRLGRLVGEAWREAPRPDLIVPVPLHRRRRLERGYNQSERLATGIGEVLERPVRTDLLARPRPTRSQTRLSQTERWQNVERAFAVPEPEAVTGRRVLLVDDVLTTGATAVAAAQPFRAAGAAVDLAVLACTRE